MVKLRILVVGAILAAARPSVADPVGDFQAGTSVRIAAGNVELGVQRRTVTGQTLTKAANTLNFRVPASAFGFASNIAMDLRGTRMPNNRIFFNINNALTPPAVIAPGVTLQRITGQLLATAVWIPGDRAVPSGNVRLQFANTSFLVVQGSFGTYNVAVKNSAVVGGIVQPALLSFTTTTPVCSDTVPKWHRFTVQLAAPARTTNAPVHLRAPPRGLHVPNAVLVRKDQRQASFDARIDRNFVGTVRLVAAAGGVERSINVAVRRREECPR